MEPNKDKKPEKRSVRFIEGKGFYIALVLCAAVIGVSAWSLLSGTKTMDSEHDQNTVLEVTPAPTIPAPETAEPTPEMTPEPEIPAEDTASTSRPSTARSSRPWRPARSQRCIMTICTARPS